MLLFTCQSFLSIFPCLSLAKLLSLDSAALLRTPTMRLLSIAVLATLPIAFGAPIQVTLLRFLIFVMRYAQNLTACKDHRGCKFQTQGERRRRGQSPIGFKSSDCS
jgi:hypothetical protein